MPPFVLLIPLMLDLPDNKSRATGTKGTTSGTIFSFPASPGEEEIEAEEHDELDVKSETIKSARKEKVRFVCPCLAFPAHPILYSRL